MFSEVCYESHSNEGYNRRKLGGRKGDVSGSNGGNRSKALLEGIDQNQRELNIKGNKQA